MYNTLLFYIFVRMKVQTAFRLDKDLLEMIKDKALAQKRSLNNYIEYLLYKDIGDIPNEETKKAIFEAHHSDDLKPIEDLEEFLDTL